jgi:subtilisin family serine protease
MKTIIKPLFILAIMALSVFSYAQESQKSQESTTYVENEFIIWLEQGVDATTFAANSNVGISPKRMLSQRLNIWLFEIADKAESREVKMDQLGKNPDVRVIQNNHTNITLREVIPDDPYYGQQWAPAIMNLPQAWEEFTTGGVTATGDTIVVAVIDGGADWTHEDLNCWINTHEIPNNGIDDDNNGYVDDYRGWNAYNHNGYVGSSHHGTHVSGIIGAVGDNEIGVCGVNWNVKVMSICGSSSDESIVVEAYSYALEMRARYNETNGEEGAFIVSTNSSFGVDYGNPDDYPIWCSMYDEMGNVGILSCGAGPNLNVNVDVVGDVPSTCPGNYLIGITNTTSQDVKNSGAGYGINNIDIGAPGTSIYSTTPNNNYGNSTGTSMATPQVSGTITLMYAALPEEMMQVCKSDPALFCLSVRQSLFDGADHLTSLDGLVASGRRLNAYGAIENLLGQTTTPTLTGVVKIDGEPVFGQTLAAITDLNSIPSIPDLGELSYQWKRDTTDIEGAVFQTYTLSEDDIDLLISVQVTAENCEGTITSPLVGPVRKAEQAMPEAPQMESNTDTSITLVTVEGCEYNINGNDWQDSPVFESLMPSTSYIFTQRKKETRSQYASPVSPEAVFCTMPYDEICEHHRSTFKVYPNPAKGCVIIEGTGNMTLTNALGQTIMTKEIIGKEKVELPKGMYFVTMGNETRKVVVE